MNIKKSLTAINVVFSKFIMRYELNFQILPAKFFKTFKIKQFLV